MDGFNETFQFNPAASAIWNLCDGTRTVDDLSAELAELVRSAKTGRNVVYLLQSQGDPAQRHFG